MKKIILLSTLLFCIFLTRAQNSDLKSRYKEMADNQAEGMLAVMNSSYKWGFVDSKTGTELIAPKYDNVWSFSEGLAGVSLNNKFGFIDKSGKEVIPLIYDDTKHRFYHGMAAVNKGATRDPIMGLHGGDWGFIDKEGKVLIPFKFSEIDPFYDEFIAVRIGGLWGFIDKTGKEIVKPIYRVVKNFSEGFATGRRYLRREEMDTTTNNAAAGDQVEAWTFFDKTGKEIIPPKYNAANPPKEGLLLVTMLPAPYQPEKYGFIDKTGKVVIELKYDGAYSFSEGLTAVYSREEKKWGYINTKGKLVIPFKYTSAYNFKDGVASVKIDSVNYFIDKTGKETKAPAR